MKKKYVKIIVLIIALLVVISLVYNWHDFIEGFKAGYRDGATGK